MRLAVCPLRGLAANFVNEAHARVCQWRERETGREREREMEGERRERTVLRVLCPTLDWPL